MHSGCAMRTQHAQQKRSLALKMKLHCEEPYLRKHDRHP